MSKLSFVGCFRLNLNVTRVFIPTQVDAHPPFYWAYQLAQWLTYCSLTRRFWFNSWHVHERWSDWWTFYGYYLFSLQLHRRNDLCQRKRSLVICYNLHFGRCKRYSIHFPKVLLSNKMKKIKRPVIATCALATSPSETEMNVILATRTFTHPGLEPATFCLKTWCSVGHFLPS